MKANRIQFSSQAENIVFIGESARVKTGLAYSLLMENGTLIVSAEGFDAAGLKKHSRGRCWLGQFGSGNARPTLNLRRLRFVDLRYHKHAAEVRP